jgi:hypothetical protein
MSWDVELMCVNPDVIPAHEISSMEELSELGLKEEVFTLLKTLFPDISIFDSKTLNLHEGDIKNPLKAWYSIRFYMADEQPVKTIGLNIHGWNSSFYAIQKICIRTGWRALDLTTGDFIDFSQDAAKGHQYIFGDRYPSIWMSEHRP